MLAIEVAFLTGRYVATAYNTRTESEWPPHPARLFSALVATHFEAEETPERARERAVLEWLEGQGAPGILASEAASREVVTVFVPVNDVALTDVDEEATRLDEAREALARAEASDDAGAVRTARGAATKSEAALKRAITRATSVPAKPPQSKYGQRVLPEFRLRQPRTFPSVTPHDPRVTYLWREASPNDEQRDSLDRLLQRVVRLGHSSSLVSVRLKADPGSANWQPALEGELTLRVVEPGQLASLEQAFEHHRELEPRVMPSTPQPYTQAVPRMATEPVAESTFSSDWLVLRRVSGVSLPMTATAGVARAVRKTLLSFADEPIPEGLSGHAADGRPSERAHLAIVPLPFVGHQHASGAILGVALVLPRASDDEGRRAVFIAVDRWERAHRREDEDTPVVQLNLGAAGGLFLDRVEWGSVQSSLRAAAWCGPASVWYSATPMALDRNPGDLRSRDPRRLTEAIGDAVEIVCTACERIGLPRPKHVEVLPAAPWAGAAKAQHYPPYPGDVGRTQRVLTHVRLEFQPGVRGPILLGAGRFFGLGLFRPDATR